MSDEKIQMCAQESAEEMSSENCDCSEQQCDAQPVENTNEVSHKKKWPLACAIVGAVVLVSVAAGILLKGRLLGVDSASEAETTVIYAVMEDDGTAHIPLADGSCVTINEDVNSAAITKDKEHIVVLLRDGTLYVTDKNQSVKNEIAENCAKFSCIRDEGFFYTDLNKIMYRVAFSDYTPLELGYDVAYTIADNSISVLYATDKGEIYTIGNTETEKKKVGTFPDTVSVKAISDNGEISVWVTETDDEQVIILNDGDDKWKLGEADGEYMLLNVFFSKDQGLAVIEPMYSDSMWIKYSNQDPFEIKLGAEPVSYRVFTNGEDLTDMQSGDVSSLYISTEADIGMNVYCISMEGDRERVLSKVSDYEIAGGNIIYTDTENTLYYSKLDGSDLVNETKIATDVNAFDLTNNGKYVYYMKNCEENIGTLYCYKMGAADSLKIKSDVACFSSSWSTTMCTTYSVDGASVLFFEDMEEIDDTSFNQGFLMLWSYGEESATKISSDVINFSVTSALDSQEVYSDGFLFKKYSEIDSDGNLHVDLMYYNGENAVKIAPDVLK